MCHVLLERQTSKIMYTVEGLVGMSYRLLCRCLRQFRHSKKFILKSLFFVSIELFIGQTFGMARGGDTKRQWKLEKICAK